MGDISGYEWGLVAFCAVLVGVAKTGLPGISILIVPLMANVVETKISVGILLGMLILGDIFAAGYYRRAAQWRHVGRLLPATICGIVVGYFISGKIDDSTLKVVIGVVVLVMLALHFLRLKFFADEIDMPHKWWFAWGLGFAAGVTTMMANAAGPVMVIYLVSMGFDKTKFVGTAAWFFFIVNWIKVPFSASLEMMTRETILFNVQMLPFIAFGAVAGIFILKKIPEKIFSVVVQVLAACAAVKLFF